MLLVVKELVCPDIPLEESQVYCSLPQLPRVSSS